MIIFIIIIFIQVFTSNEAVQKITVEMLNTFNADAGTGEGKDSIFIYKIINILWGQKKLKKRSVTGLKSNAFKEISPYKALEREKLEFIYGEYSKIPMLNFKAGFIPHLIKA